MKSWKDRATKLLSDGHKVTEVTRILEKEGYLGGRKNRPISGACIYKLRRQNSPTQKPRNTKTQIIDLAPTSRIILVVCESNQVKEVLGQIA